MKEYYYIDIDIKTMKVADWGLADTASPTGDMGIEGIYRVYLTKGQFNKLKAKLSKRERTIG